MRATIAGIFCVTAVHSTATRGQTETFRSVEFVELVCVDIKSGALSFASFSQRTM